MFEKGEYIIYGRSGICQIEDITHLNIAGADQKRLYYVLAPLNIKGNKVYFPVDKKNANARRVITEQEAWALLEELPGIQEIIVSNEKLREESYRQALNSCDYRQWVAISLSLKYLCKYYHMYLSSGSMSASAISSAVISSVLYVQ